MSYRDLYDKPNQSYLEQFPSRQQIIQTLAKKNWCDVLVIGGGIHGACFARISALHGLKTILLERDDYAFGTSSRTSKMAHGGLRYLEMLDFKQVFEGIRAREDLLEAAPHLVKAHNFLIPILKQNKFLKLKLHLGLTLYDWLLKDKTRRHRWLPAANLNFQNYNHKNANLLGCFEYYDGILNDARLVIENIVAARQEGAICLNYAEVMSLSQRDNGKVRIGWFDKVSQVSREIEAGMVVNCAGPWVPFVGRLKPQMPNPLVYSQGAHLLFSTPWRDPAVLLPLAEKHRYYFVWPHFAGTLVGTTETPVETPDLDPKPFKAEIEEILERLAIDLPHSGLNRNNLHYCFAGTRALPIRGNNQTPASVSRRHIWSYANGVLSLLGGKFTTAQITVEEGLKILLKLAGQKVSTTSLLGRKLPGAAAYTESIEGFRAATQALNQEAVDGAIRRLGSRVRFLLEKPEALQVLGGHIFRGEVEIGIVVEQALHLEDIMRRRLDLELIPGHGVELLGDIVDILVQYYPEFDRAELAQYEKHMQEIATLIAA